MSTVHELAAVKLAYYKESFFMWHKVFFTILALVVAFFIDKPHLLRPDLLVILGGGIVFIELVMEKHRKAKMHDFLEEVRNGKIKPISK